jgi:hypothetical protein
MFTELLLYYGAFIFIFGGLLAFAHHLYLESNKITWICGLIIALEILILIIVIHSIWLIKF